MIAAEMVLMAVLVFQIVSYEKLRREENFLSSPHSLTFQLAYFSYINTITLEHGIWWERFLFLLRSSISFSLPNFLLMYLIDSHLVHSEWIKLSREDEMKIISSSFVRISWGIFLRATESFSFLFLFRRKFILIWISIKFTFEFLNLFSSSFFHFRAHKTNFGYEIKFIFILN